jgi:hypothetical protein
LNNLVEEEVKRVDLLVEIIQEEVVEVLGELMQEIL